MGESKRENERGKRGIDGLVNKNKWEIEWKIGVFDLREIGKRGENKIKKYFLK